MSTIQQKFTSGHSNKLIGYIPIPTDENANIIVLGNSPGFLSRLLEAEILKKQHTRNIVAPRLVTIPSKNKRSPSFGSSEAFQLKKDGLIQTIAINNDQLHDNGFILDITPQAEFAKTVLWQVPSIPRHDLVIETLNYWIPPESKNDQFIIIEFPFNKDNSIHNKLSNLAKLDTPIDHVLYELYQLTPEKIFKYGLNNIFLISSNFKHLSRLDIRDKLTDSSKKILNVFYSLEKLWYLDNQVIDSPIQVTEPTTQEVDAPVLSSAKLIIKKLKDTQDSVLFPLINGKSISISNAKTSKIDLKLIEKTAQGDFINPKLAKPTFDSISSSYIDSGMLDKDMINILASLSEDPIIPHFIQKIERKNSSDSMNHKESLTVQYKDLNNKSTTITIDIPVISRDGYLNLNGNKYNITKQILALPVIKVRPNRVLITTAYNKATVERFGQNASSATSYIRLIIAYLSKNPNSSINMELASATSANLRFRSTIEYDDLAKTVRYIKSDNFSFIFSRIALNDEIHNKVSWALPYLKNLENTNGHAIGWINESGKIYVVYNLPNGNIIHIHQDGTNEYMTEEYTIGNQIADTIRPIVATIPRPSTINRKYIYSRVKMLSQYLPTAVIIGYDIGLIPLLKLSKVEYKLVGINEFNKSQFAGSDIIKFKDMVLTFNPNRIRHSLLLNGLKELDSEDTNIGDYIASGLGWINHIADVLGGPGHAKALINYQSSFIDPITKDLLTEMNLPTDMSGVLLLANNMLEDNIYKEPNDMSNYRMRGPELINSILYKVLHKEMEKVRATRESATPQRLLFNQSEVIKQVQMASNVEEVSELNPLLEAELRGKATWTGAAGGLSDSQTVNRGMRAFHSTMHGIFGYYSPDSIEIGVKRTLAFNTGVKDVRGRFDMNSPKDDASRVLSLGELISPFTSQHSDPPRIAMQSKQATHTMPIVKHTPLLVGSGVEKSLANAVSNTYTYKAKYDGKVISIDEEHNLVKLKYADGSFAYIDMAPRSIKNSGGGFYITAQLILNPGIKLNSTFKANQILAHDESFFGTSSDGATSYKSGILVRTALTALDQTFEDSIMVTKKLTKDTKALVTMSRSVNFGAKANLQSIAKIGDKVSTNSALAVFENITDDADISAILQKVGMEFDSAISELTKNTAVAKYTGKIVEMRTFYNRELHDLSPSLQKFLKSQESEALTRKQLVADAPVDAPVKINSPIKVTRNKIAGETLDGVLVIFLIQIEDEAGPGDKLTLSTALKGIISRVFEDGEEPEDEDGNTIDYVVSPLSVVSRMTSDFFLSLWCNAVLVDLKKEVLNIYNS
jgi:hypothetical protein